MSLLLENMSLFSGFFLEIRVSFVGLFSQQT